MSYTISTGHKKSPLGLIPQDWISLKLGEIAKFSKGKGVAKGELQNIGNFSVIHYGELFREYGSVIDETNNFIGSNENRYLSEKGDVLMPTSDVTPTGIATASTVNRKGIVLGGDILVIRLDQKKIDNIYLTYFIRHHRKQTIRLVTGSTVYHIYGKDMEKFNLIFPKRLSEQKAIASILSSCDKTIDDTQKLIEKIELRHKALCQQLLTGKKRVEGFDNEIEKIQIQEFASQYSTKNKEDKKLIVLSCTKYNGLVPSLEYFGRKVYSDNLTTYKIVPNNAFAYATNHIEEGSIGYQDKHKEALISPMYTIFKTNDSVNDYYLFLVLKTHELIHQYNKRMTGSIDRRGGLRWDEFSKIQVYLPGIKEQEAILLIINQSKIQINGAKEKLANIKLLKKGLMQELLTGKTRIPASYLSN